MKKRVLSMLLAIVMLVSLIPTYAIAEGTPEIYVDTTDIGDLKAGDSVSIPVAIKNNPGIMGAYFEFDIPDVLTYVSYENKSGADSIVWTAPNMVQWDYDTDYSDMYTQDGVLYVLNFTVNADVDAGTYGFGVSLLDDTAENLHNGSDAVTATFTPGSITIKHNTAGLNFNSGSQTGLTYEQVKAEAEGAQGAVTLATPGENHYFAGWFTGLDVTADANGFYVVDPATKATFAGTEYRPFYENPPTEGTYHALWVKGDGTNSYVLTLGTTNTVHFGTTPSTVLSTAIAAANGNRTKLVMDLDLASTKVTPTVAINLDMNGCKLLAGTTRVLTLTDTTGNVIESSRAGGTFKSRTSTATSQYIYDKGQFDRIRDITFIGTKGSNPVIKISSAAKIENCVFEGYIQFNGTAGTTLIDNCTITTSANLITSIPKDATVTVTNTTMNSSASGTTALFTGTSGAGVLNLGSGNTLTATTTNYLFQYLDSANFLTVDSSYQIAPGGSLVRVLNDIESNVTCPDDMSASIDGSGYVRFGEICTITYIKDDGSVETKTAVKGYGVDLAYTYVIGNGKEYKIIGWTTQQGGTEPLTELTATGDMTLYAVKGRVGVIFGNDAKEYESGSATYTYNNSNANPFVIYNADRLGELDGMTLNARSTNAKVIFSAEALDAIAAQVNGSAKDISVVLYYKTSGLTQTGAKVGLQFAMSYDGQPVDLPETGVEVQIKVGATSSLGKYRQFTVYAVTTSGSEALDASVFTSSSNYWASALLTENATYEVVMGENHYLPETNMTGDVSVSIKTAGEHLVVENAAKLADLNSLDVSGNNMIINFSSVALDSIAANAAAGELTIHQNNVTPSEGAAFRAELMVKDANGNTVDFDGAVTVQINFPFEEGKNYRAYYIPETGDPVALYTEIGEYSSTYKKAIFTTTHFSAFEIRETTVADGYTAALNVVETEVRAGGNTVNVTVNVSHSNKTKYNAGEVKVTFDSTLLTFNETASVLPVNAECKVSGNELTVEFYGDEIDLPDSINLAFTTCDSVAADTVTTITLTGAAFADSVEAQTSDLIAATLDPAADVVTIQLKAFEVTKDEATVGGLDQAVTGEDYNFTITKDNNYVYTVTATVNGNPVTVTESTTEPGKYTIAGADVTGPIVITYTKVAKQYNVTFSGEAPAANDGGKATYAVDYHFTLQTVPQWKFEATVTIAGQTFAEWTLNENVITIPGARITGDIAINITKIQTEFNVTVSGEGVTWVVTGGDGDAVLEKGEAIAVTITPVPDYEYTVVVTDKLGNPLTVNGPDGNTYTVPNIESDIVVTVTKTLKGTVEVTQYIQLDNQSMWLVTYAPTTALTAGYAAKYNDADMYWSEKYNAYCYLVVSETLTPEDAKAVVAVKASVLANEEIAYTMNVNGSTNIDAADAQLVYDMYSAVYAGFDTVGMKKFLLADIYVDKQVDMTDAAAIVTAVLAGEAL